MSTTGILEPNGGKTIRGISKMTTTTCRKPRLSRKQRAAATKLLTGWPRSKYRLPDAATLEALSHSVTEDARPGQTPAAAHCAERPHPTQP